MADEKKDKPKLQSLGDMFNKVNAETQTEDVAEGSGRKEIKIDKLVPYKNHKYKLYTGERLAAMVDDIRNNGIISPLVIRPIEGSDCYEVLVGHNRLNAATIAGFETVPYELREGLSERDALKLVHRSNLNQRSFNDLSFRERIDVINQYYTEFPEMQSSDEAESNADESNGWNLSQRQIQRYSKCVALCDDLVTRLDNKEYTFTVAYNLAFLLNSEQTLLEEILCNNKFKIDEKKSESLKKEVGHLNESRIFEILEGKKKTRKAKEVVFKLSKELILKHFSSKEYTNTEIEEIVAIALEKYFEGVPNE